MTKKEEGHLLGQSPTVYEHAPMPDTKNMHRREAHVTTRRDIQCPRIGIHLSSFISAVSCMLAVSSSVTRNLEEVLTRVRTKCVHSLGSGVTCALLASNHGTKTLSLADISC
jgi:hypothetical protein